MTCSVPIQRAYVSPHYIYLTKRYLPDLPAAANRSPHEKILTGTYLPRVEEDQ